MSGEKTDNIPENRCKAVTLFLVQFTIISASLAIKAEQSGYVIDHVVSPVSVRTSVLWQNG